MKFNDLATTATRAFHKAGFQLKKHSPEILVVTGVVGTVVSVKEDKIVIETSADQVRIELMKWSISSNETAVAAAREETKKKQEAKAKAKATKKA